jgi:hypothetical protein
MAIIKPMLREELENSVKLQAFYEEKLKHFPSGTIQVKNIKGHNYNYLAKRVDGRVKYSYMGKMTGAEKGKYLSSAKKRAELRKNISTVKKQIKYLKGVLRGKEPI